MSKRAYSLKPL